MHYFIYLQTPLHLTARGSHVESFQLLLEYGARIDVKDANRETPMQLAGQKKEFKYAIARYQIPTRTNEEEAVVEGKLLSIAVTVHVQPVNLVSKKLRNGLHLVLVKFN